MRNRDCNDAFLWGLFIGVTLMGSSMCCVFVRTSVFHSQVIEHGAAYYHPETGEFTWKDEESE